MVLRIVRTINCWRRWADYNLADQDLTGEYYTGEQRTVEDHLDGT